MCKRWRVVSAIFNRNLDFFMIVTGETISYNKTADQAIVNSIALTPITEIQPDIVDRSIYFKCWVPFTLAGAVSGFQFQFAATSTRFKFSAQVFDNAGVLVASSIQLANGIITAVPAAGNYILIAEGRGFQISALAINAAQAVADANALTILRESITMLLNT